MADQGLQTEAMLAGLICGATLILVAYNAFLGLYTRERIYFSFSGLAISVLLFQISFLGRLTDLLSGTITDLMIPTSLLLATGVLGADFLRRMLREAGSLVDSPAIRTWIFLSVALIPIFALRPDWFGTHVYLMVMLPMALFGYLSVQALQNGYRPASAMIIGLSLSLVAGTIQQLHQWQIIPDYLFLRAAPPLGALFTLFAFSIALGIRIRSLDLERLGARTKEAFLRSLVEATPFPVLVLQKPLGRPLFWNQAASDIYDAGPAWNLRNLMDSRDQAFLRQALRKKQALDRALFSIRSRTGRTMQVALSVRNVLFSGKRCYLHIHVDRTLEIETREALEKEQQALEKATAEAKASTMARDDFIAAMSHEIRTPMSGILSAAELLEESSRSAPIRSQTIKPESVLSTLQRNAYRLLQLLNDILDYARITAGKMEPSPHRFRLVDFTRTTISRLEPMFRQANLIILYEAPANEQELRADSGAIRQILDRLSFSLLSSRRDGTVSVSHEIGAGEVRFKIHVQARSLLGADPELLQRIVVGSRNYRPRNARELSLTVARGLLQMLGARLDLRKSDTRESELELSFPVEVLGESKERKSHQRPSIRILLFEDNEDNSVLMQRLLQKQGYKVTVAATAGQGIEMIKEETPDLVLMDLHLPDMDGFQATRSMQEAYGPECPPVAALSASTLERDKKEAMETGMVGFLSKPIQKEQFESLIEELFSQN